MSLDRGIYVTIYIASKGTPVAIEHSLSKPQTKHLYFLLSSKSALASICRARSSKGSAIFVMETGVSVPLAGVDAPSADTPAAFALCF